MTLWVVERGKGSRHIVGYDPDQRRLVQGRELFERVRGASVEHLADLANAMLHNGECCILVGADPGWPKDTTGAQPRAPYADGRKLVFWRTSNDEVHRFEVEIEEGMLAPPGAPTLHLQYD